MVGGVGFLSDRRERKEQERAAEERFGQAAGRIASGNPSEVTAGLHQLRSDSGLDLVAVPRKQRVAGETIRAYAAAAMADDLLTEEEES